MEQMSGRRLWDLYLSIHACVLIKIATLSRTFGWWPRGVNVVLLLLQVICTCVVSRHVSPTRQPKRARTLVCRFDSTPPYEKRQKENRREIMGRMTQKEEYPKMPTRKCSLYPSTSPCTVSVLWPFLNADHAYTYDMKVPIFLVFSPRTHHIYRVNIRPHLIS